MSRLTIFTIPLFFIFFSSCQERSQTTELKPQAYPEFQFLSTSDLEEGMMGIGSKLTLYAQFDECGEWGGHTETFDISIKQAEVLQAKYTRTKVDCEKINELYGTPEFHQPDTVINFVLTADNIRSINRYISSLLLSKKEERFSGNSGRLFEVSNADSTFLISVYDYRIENLDNYNELLRSLHLPKVKVEYQ